MRKRAKRLLLVSIILVLSLTVSACKKEEVREIKDYPTLITEELNNIKEDEINQYEIDIDFNPEEKTYTGSQTVLYINNEDIELGEIYFHLYPNAFKTVETVPILFDDMDRAFPQGFEPGYIDMNKILVDNKEISFTVEGEGDTILKINLEEPLKPKEKIEIKMEYAGALPPAEDRFGYGEKTYNFGNWYPIACVYDEKGWNTDPYYSIGDPFYSDVSNYNVTITTPKDMIVASSGNILSEKSKKGKKIWNIEGKLIRDFAWVCSTDFVVEEREVDGTLIKVYFLEDNAKIKKVASNMTEDAIRKFNTLFGRYPYGQYSVVMNSFPSGMEYPGLVYIAENYCTMATKEFLEIIIVHETAHQWWYGVVGNDQIDEAWLDESLATYSEVIYMNEVYGKDHSEDYYDVMVVESYERAKQLFDIDDKVLKPLDEFDDWNDYGSLAYSRGAMFINSIKKDFGEDVLYDILNKYYEEYKFLNATTDDFLKVCEEVTGESFKERKEKWLHGEN